MSYDSYFTFTTIEVDPAFQNDPSMSSIVRLFFQDLEKIANYRFEGPEHHYQTNGSWYEAEAHIVTNLRRFPAITKLVLHREGDENGDVEDIEFHREGSLMVTRKYKYEFVRSTSPQIAMYAL